MEILSGHSYLSFFLSVSQRIQWVIVVRILNHFPEKRIPQSYKECHQPEISKANQQEPSTQQALKSPPINEIFILGLFHLPQEIHLLFVAKECFVSNLVLYAQKSSIFHRMNCTKQNSFCQNIHLNRILEFLIYYL